MAAAFIGLITAVFLPIPQALPFYLTASAFAALSVLMVTRPRPWVAGLSITGGLFLVCVAIWDQLQNPTHSTGPIAVGLYGLAIVAISAVVLWREDHSSQ